jgi:integrase/recombinase XerD
MTKTMDREKDPERRCLKMAVWPVADRQAWEAAVQPDSMFEDGGLGARWAPTTRETNICCYGRWLGWLQRNELLDPMSGPADRVTPERIRGYVASLLSQNAASTTASRIRHLYCVLRAMALGHDWGWMRDIESRIRRSAVSVRNKRALLEPSDQLYSYGVELMDQADGPAGGTILRRAQYYRDGLLIALLAARLFRRRNLSSIEIGRHLLPQGQGYRLCFEAAETKTNRRIERTFPAPLVPYLERYISHYRALLDPRTRGSRKVSTAPRPPTAALWITMHGRPMGAAAVYCRIVALTKAKFGHAISPHLFRDCGGTSIANEVPEHVHIAMSALGHSTFKTGQRYYIHAESMEAVKLYQGEVHAQKRRGRAHQNLGARPAND